MTSALGVVHRTDDGSGGVAQSGSCRAGYDSISTWPSVIGWNVCPHACEFCPPWFPVGPKLPAFVGPAAAAFKIITWFILE